MSTSIGLRRSALALILVAALLAALQAAPAAADTADTAGAFEGIATLNAGISAACTGNIHPGTFTGAFEGVHGTTPAAGTMTATYLYCNSDTIAGTAQGTFTVTPVALVPPHTCDFTWVRTGVVAMITIAAAKDCPEGGSATAAFAPLSAPGATPGMAAVVGAGSWS